MAVEIRSSIADINPECGIASKQLAMSDSATHRLPLHASSMRTWSASCAERLGRNPNEHSSMSASKIGSMTIFVAACTIRSRTAGIESGRRSCGLPGFGMNTRRAGSGRQRPSFRSAASSSSSLVDAVLLDVGDGLSVDAGRAAVGAHQLPRPLQNVSAVDLVIERVEPSSGIGLGRPVERSLQFSDCCPARRS